MKSAVAFSGGYDSTYLLYKLLYETDDEVTAITFMRKTEDGNGKENFFIHPEPLLAQVPELVTELQKIRSFTHITQIVNPSDVVEENSAIISYFVKYCIDDINSGKYDRLGTGRSWEQWNDFQVSYMKGLVADIAAQRLFDRDAKRGKLWMPFVTDDFHDKYCRWHVLKYLPEKYQKIAISCCEPVNVDGQVRRCDQCHKCIWDDKVREMIDQGWNSTQVNEWRFLKGIQYGGGNNLCAATRFWMPLDFDKGKILYGLDTKEKVIKYTQTRRYYSIANKKNEGIWKF